MITVGNSELTCVLKELDPFISKLAYRVHRTRTYNVCENYEDVKQNIIEHMLIAYPKYNKSRGSLKGYLYMIARSRGVCKRRSHLNKHKALSALTNNTMSVHIDYVTDNRSSNTENNTSDQLLLHKVTNYVQKLVNQGTLSIQALKVMKYKSQGMSYEEMGNNMHLSGTRVRTIDTRTQTKIYNHFNEKVQLR